MNKVIIPLIVAVVLAVMSVIADTFIRLSGSEAKFVDLRLFLIGSLIYISTIFGWFYVFKHLKFTTIGVFYGISSLLVLVLFGIIYFNESINSYEIVGIILAIISMILLGKFA